MSESFKSVAPGVLEIFEEVYLGGGGGGAQCPPPPPRHIRRARSFLFIEQWLITHSLYFHVNTTWNSCHLHLPASLQYLMMKWIYLSLMTAVKVGATRLHCFRFFCFIKRWKIPGTLFLLGEDDQVMLTIGEPTCGPRTAHNGFRCFTMVRLPLLWEQIKQWSRQGTALSTCLSN